MKRRMFFLFLFVSAFVATPLFSNAQSTQQYYYEVPNQEGEGTWKLWLDVTATDGVATGYVMDPEFNTIPITITQQYMGGYYYGVVEFYATFSGGSVWMATGLDSSSPGFDPTHFSRNN